MSRIDNYSFIIGMVAAFGECVAQEAKKMALSPPFYPRDIEVLEREVERICSEQGICFYLDMNLDIKERDRVYWWVFYKFPEVLDEYVQIRNKGENPAWEFEKFKKLLSYGTVWGEGACQVLPKIRKETSPMDSVTRILFPNRGWPIAETARETKTKEELK